MRVSDAATLLRHERAFTKLARTGVVDYVVSRIEATCRERSLGCAIQRKVSSWARSVRCRFADPFDSGPLVA